MADIGRYIRHPAAGAAAPDGWFAPDRPLGAGRAQLFLGNNIQHLLRENAMRPLAAHPGVRGIYRQATSPLYTGVPAAGDVSWTYLPTDGGLSLCLGTHYVWKIPGTARFPRLVCRATWWVGSNEPTLGAALFVVPGRGVPTFRHEGVGYTTTSKSREAFKAGINLNDGDLEGATVAPREASATVPADESGRLFLFTAYLGGYCDSGSSLPADCGYMTGITLGLEEPT